MMKLVAWCWRAAASLALLFVASCGGGSDGDECQNCAATIESITVSPASASIAPGQRVPFTAAAFDAQGMAVGGVAFTWSSSDPAIATVDASGVATGVAGGTVTIRASAGAVTSSPVALTISTPQTGTSSESLIDAALAAGAIDAETALVYKLYAAFGDSRLPAAYAGDDSGVFETHIVGEAAARYDTLSAATQDLIAPFLRRPASIGSWLDDASATTSPTALAGTRERRQGIVRCLGNSGQWTSIARVVGGKVKVWYDTRRPGDSAVASFVLNEFETRAWPKLIGTYGFPAPLPDSSIVGCDGGDDLLDVYIVDPARLPGERGQTHPDSTSNKSPAFILLKATLSQTGEMQHAIAHELMHAIQWSTAMSAPHESQGYKWFLEGMANWAAAEVYPNNTTVHEQATCYLNAPHLSINDASKNHCTGTVVERYYGTYLLFQYISRTLGPTMVRQILGATQIQSTGVDAVDYILAGGLQKHWPLFAKTLWNQPPFGPAPKPPSFEQWDMLTEKPKLAPDLPQKTAADLNGAVEDATPLVARIDNLSSKYYHFTFTTDPKTRSVMFHNTFYGNRKAGEKVNVQALFLVEGSQNWQEEDWTEYEWIGVCRDAKMQRLAELVIIVSSAEWTSTNPKVVAAKVPRLMRNNVGCWAFAGSSKRTTHDKQWNSAGVVTSSFTSKFGPPPSGFPNQYTNASEGRLRVPLAAPLFIGGQYHLKEDYISGGCHYQADAAGSSPALAAGMIGPPGPGTSTGLIMINNFVESLPPALRASQELLLGTTSRAYFAEGHTNQEITGSVASVNVNLCPAPVAPTYKTNVAAWLLSSARTGGPRPVVANDGHLKGSFPANAPTDSVITEFTWDLQPLRE